MILLPQKVAYRGTLTGLRISAVDGTAFIDACAALVPYADGSHLVEIYDASGRMLRGYLGAAGDGETYTELLTNGDMEAGLVSWTTTIGTTATLSQSTEQKHAGTYSRKHVYATGLSANDGGTVAVGGLYRPSVWLYLPSGQGLSYIYLAHSLTGSFVEYQTTTTDAWVQKQVYATAFATTAVIGVGSRVSGAGDYIYSDDMSMPQVLTPSATGATIVSAKGGATQNFAYKNASFTYNAATNYVIVREAR